MSEFNKVHAERLELQDLARSDFGAFRTIVMSDPLKAPPIGKSHTAMIEDYLRAKFGDEYSADPTGLW